MKNPLFILILTVTIFLVSCDAGKTVQFMAPENDPVIEYGISKLREHLSANGYSFPDHPEDTDLRKIFFLTPDRLADVADQDFSADFEGIDGEGYRIKVRDNHIYVLGGNARGVLYGTMDVLEQMEAGTEFENLEERAVNPRFSFRAIKFNLPWSPYRPGPATDLHTETCRDLAYWEAFMDMMVRNRFNALTLWNTHPFPYMIRAKNYPKATPFDDQELAEWQTFWKTLFKMAKERGLETYLVNWNIVVSPEFAEAYGAEVHDDRSELVKTYTRESVTQLINEYEDLTGLGVTLADWMGNWGDDLMTPVEREDWIQETFVEGMKQADRKAKFIHRAVLAGDPMEMRRVIDYADLPEKTIVEVKFNWSHGHSTPDLSLTHSNNDGTIMRAFWDPTPENYFIAWMIRNEDFFVLRWGDPEFIRDHIRTNQHPYVDGYFVGSEGYIPAVDYSHIPDHPHKTWQYAFEKQWMFYHLWGRLLYDGNISDESLAQAIRIRYPNSDPIAVLNAYSLASKAQLAIPTFYKGTWDFTLYSEGFLAPWQAGFDDQQSPFISVEELINHEVLDRDYLNIREFCQMIKDGNPIDEVIITPPEHAQEVQENAEEALSLIEQLTRADNPPALQSELADLETWCYLGLYFADKIRAGVALENFRLNGEESEKKHAVALLNQCLTHWEKVISLTEDRYQPMPYVSFGHHQPRWPDFTAFHWNLFLNDVKADIAFAESMEN